MDLYNLGHVHWLDSQLLYHALPRTNREGLFILAPSTPYVCIGYHQDAAQEVDMEYCREHNIPVFRREVGGGAVFLDGNQIFFQLILHEENPLAQGDKQALYQRLLQPVVEVYHDLGVDAVYRPVNDIVTREGRKIAGVGIATIANHIVLVGYIIADFDYDTMVRVLRVPDEKYRDGLYESMYEDLTTLKREIGHEIYWHSLVVALVKRFRELLGQFDLRLVPNAVREEAKRLEPMFLSENWLYRVSRRHPDFNVRTASGGNVLQRVYEAPGGLLRAAMQVKDNVLVKVSLSGSLFCYPEDAIGKLEAVLAGTTLASLADTLNSYYQNNRIETPGVTTEDWLKLLAHE